MSASATTAENLAIQTLQLENEALKKELKILQARLDKTDRLQQRLRESAVKETQIMTGEFDELRLEVTILKKTVLSRWESLTEDVKELKERRGGKGRVAV